MNHNLCGIDEAGRGPIAGDLVIAGCVLHNFVDGVMDSKKLSQKKRELLYEIIIQNSTHYIVTFSSKNIDENGLSFCIKKGLEEIKKNIPSYEYLFDGNSTFGVDGIKTMIKADSKVSAVSAASILAKVTHDRNIIKDAKLYPMYEFEKHKGYGTPRHIELIKKYGYSEIHRKSYKLKSLNGFVIPSLF